MTSLIQRVSRTNPPSPQEEALTPLIQGPPRPNGLHLHMASKNSQTIPSPSPRPMGPSYRQSLFLFPPVALGQRFLHSFSPYGIEPKVHQDFLPLWPWAENPKVFSPPAPLVKPECPLLSIPFPIPTSPKIRKWDFNPSPSLFPLQEK